MKYRIVGSFLVVIVVISGTLLFGNNESIAPVAQAGFGEGKTVVMYKSPTCGCCSGYAKALEAEGFTVEIIKEEDMSVVKKNFGITQGNQSCHTMTIDGYVVEGHVPLEAFEKLLTERPSIDGIGLARMPAGTPGMPGKKRASYEVYQLSEGVFSPYVTI